MNKPPKTKSFKPLSPIQPAQNSQTVHIGLESIFAEHVSGLTFGPFVSKFSLAKDLNPDINALAPLLTVILPTNILYAFAKQVVLSLENDENRDKLKSAIEQYQNALDGKV